MIALLANFEPPAHSSQFTKEHDCFANTQGGEERAMATIWTSVCLALLIWIDNSLLTLATAFLLPSDRKSRPKLPQSSDSDDDSCRPIMAMQTQPNNTGMHAYVYAEAVIFDVDGTLADSGHLGFAATLELLEKYAILPITYQEYRAHTRYTTPDRLARHAGLVPGTIEFQERGRALAQEFDDLYIAQVSLETAPFFPGMLDLLRAISPSVKIAALTNAACRYAHAVLQVNDAEPKWLYRRFASIRGADDVPKPKPFPDGLWQICSELGVSADRCVYIGDSPSDGEAAKAAGMSSIAVGWGAHPMDRLSPSFDATANSVDQLMNLLIRVP
jgi:HAD superfamily hydrolase (TIGR01509 family)